MKIRSVTVNNRKNQIELTARPIGVTASRAELRCATRSQTEERSMTMAAWRLCVGLIFVFVVARSPAAHACAPSGWRDSDSDAGLPSCIELDWVAEGEFELSNTCSDDLILSADDCATCTVPSAIAAGESEIIELGPSPEANVHVEIDFESGAQSGTLGFDYRYNPCPESSGDCTIAPGEFSNAPSMWVAVLLGLAALRLRRLNKS